MTANEEKLLSRLEPALMAWLTAQVPFAYEYFSHGSRYTRNAASVADEAEYIICNNVCPSRKTKGLSEKLADLLNKWASRPGQNRSSMDRYRVGPIGPAPRPSAGFDEMFRPSSFGMED